MRKFEGFYRGINLGGWLSQGSLEKEHLDTFITEDDIIAIKNMGIDHIRIPVDFELIEDENGALIEEGHTYIRKGIDWCLKHGFNVVLDLHKTAGYVFDDAAYSNGFFDNTELQERFINLWKELATRYGNEPDRVALELLNEVVDPSVADKWNAIARRAIQAIREITPYSWIIVGGTRNNSVVSVKELGAPYDERIAYTFHCYEPLIFTHQGAYWIENMPEDYRISYPDTIGHYVQETQRLIDPAFAYPIKHISAGTTGKDFFRKFFVDAIEVAEKYNVPLYCGEYGMIDRANPEDVLRWFEDIHAVFEEFQIARTVWTYKEKDFGIIGDHYKPIWDKLIKCL